MKDVIQIVEDALGEKGKNMIEMPPKIGIHPKANSFIHAMPAYIPRMKTAGLKWIGGFPDNHKHNLPYITSVLVLNDTDSGAPLCIMNADWITAQRTGAATAVAAKYLAREDSKVFGILGCGAEGRSNLEAIYTVFKDLEEVRAYDIMRKNLEKYSSEMADKYDLRIVQVDSPRKAVEGSDIVVTAGPILKDPRPMIEAAWFKVGGFACPLDFDSYWKPEAMRSMHKFCIDDLEQFDYYKSKGYLCDTPGIYADLAEIIMKRKAGRENESERAMCMNLGLAIEDIATATKLYEQALSSGIGIWLQS